MEDEMSELFTFLENFKTDSKIKIYDETGSLLFDGKIGDVPQKISNKMSVIKETVEIMGSCIYVKVIKSYSEDKLQ